MLLLYWLFSFIEYRLRLLELSKLLQAYSKYLSLITESTSFNGTAYNKAKGR